MSVWSYIEDRGRDLKNAAKGSVQVFGPNGWARNVDFTDPGSGVRQLVSDVTSPSTQTTTNSIPEWQQKNVQFGMDAAKNGFYSGISAGYPTLSQETWNGINGITNISRNNPFTGTATNTLTEGANYSNPYASGYRQFVGQQSPNNQGVQNTINQSGSNPYGSAAIGAANSPNYGTSYLNSVIPGMNDNETKNMLSATARGDYLNGNPYLDSIAAKATQKANDAFAKNYGLINSNFAVSGRYGSNANKEAVTDAMTKSNDSIGAMLNDLYGGNYNFERGNQLNAINQIGNINSQNLGRQLTAGGMLSQNYGSDTGNRLNAYGLASNNFNTGINNAYQGYGLLNNSDQFYKNLGLNATGGMVNSANADQGIRLDNVGMMPSIRNMQYQDPMMNLTGGGIVDAYNVNKTNYPLDLASRYMAAISGNYGGTQTSPGPSQFDTWLGRGAKLATIATPFITPSPTGGG